jgi:hypothetical protein
MSQYYQTTQGSTQYQLANIIAQGSSQTITGYNIQYIPATNTAFETQSSDTGYKYKQGVSTGDVTSGASVYYQNFTSATKIPWDGTYNKCSIVACSGGGGGGGGGGAGFEGDNATSFGQKTNNGDYKTGGNGGSGGQGVVAVYKDISLTPYQYITVNINSAGGGGGGGQSTGSGRKGEQGTSGYGKDGTSGQAGSYVKLTGTSSSGTSQILTVNGGNGGSGGQGGGKSDGGNGSSGSVGSVTANYGTSNATKSFAGDLTVTTNSCNYGGKTYGDNGNGGDGNTSSGNSDGGNGNTGTGSFARIYFYK